MKKITICLLALAGLCNTAWAQQPAFQAGTHYEVLEQSAGYRGVDGVEVTEVFSYLCNHCMTFEPYMQAWKQRMPEGVQLNRIPVEFGRAAWGLYARAYVAASVMGIADAAHVPMMDAIWKDKKQMRNMDQLAEFYSGFGVDKARFLATAESFAVDMRLRREQQLVREYGVSGTPTMIVNGKYRVSSNTAVSDFDKMLAVVDFLVAQELAAESAEQATAATAAGG